MQNRLTSNRSPWQGDAVTRRAILFEAHLEPNRSLSRTGFGVVMVGICALSFIAGLVFFWAGAWPVIGFLGLDVLFIYLAFRANYIHGNLREEVRLTNHALGVRRLWPSGRVQTWTLEPYWARVELEGDTREPSGLVIRSKADTVRIGGFLSAAERLDLADELDRALAAAR